MDVFAAHQRLTPRLDGRNDTPHQSRMTASLTITQIPAILEQVKASTDELVMCEISGFSKLYTVVAASAAKRLVLTSSRMEQYVTAVGAKTLSRKPSRTLTSGYNCRAIDWQATGPATRTKIPMVE
eukprot:3687410-Amphidinium_carterae.3